MFLKPIARPLGGVLLLAAISLLALELAPWTEAKVAAAVYLYCLAPGYLFMRLILPEQTAPERLLFSVASGLALSTLVVLAVVSAASPPTQEKVIFTLVALLLLLSAATWLWPQRVTTPKVAFSLWASLGLVLLLAGVLRFTSLGYAEFQDDEIDVASVALRVIRGEEGVLFQDRRGPVQPVISVSFALLADKPLEWVLRIPSALANWAAVGALFLLAWRLFDRRVALVSGLLLAVEGFVLAYGRVVQMQSMLILMMVLTVVCGYLAVTSAERGLYRRYTLLLAYFFGVGLLAHYEMALMAPIIAYLYGAKRGARLWREDGPTLAWALMTLLAVAGLFYLPFVLNPAFRATFAYYREDIVGRAVRNNLPQYVRVATFYNSIYAFALLWLLLIGGWLWQLARLLPTRGRAIAVALLGCLLGAPIVGAFFSSGQPPWLGLFIYSALWLIVALAAPIPLAHRLLTLWLLTFFILYSFFLREVHIHYYVYSAPWTLLAGWALVALRDRVQRPYRWALGGLLAALLAISTDYAWLVFLRPAPEYALTYPQTSQPWFFTVDHQRHGEAFGFPHKSGWKTISYLYQTGQLRGAYETNELYLKAHWYTRRPQPADGPPRYYFVAEVPHRLQAAPWPTPLDSTQYAQIGAVTVRDQVRLRIYERGASPDQPVQIYPAEAYEAAFAASAGIENTQREETFQADDRFFAEAARFLEAAEQPGDVLMLYRPEQSQILGYTYQGALPYRFPASTDLRAPDQAVQQLFAADRAAGRVFALLWGYAPDSSEARFERSLNEYLFKRAEQWFGNVRLAQYDRPQTPAAALAQPLVMQLGEQIRLLGYTLSTAEQVQLTLFWQASQPVATRYKVFVHVLTPANDLVTQNDSEPVGGAYPTDRWGAAEIIRDNYALTPPTGWPLGRYHIAVGLYDPSTGVRLAVYDEQHQRQPDDRIELATFTVNPQ